ncbi:hypothetical protein VNO77_22449 [Canavalia gladiata]|uniref:Uncharacterized protein n=1 Tax=Canavalia gladiata TaxID=3824 RepID=A0AAN9L2M5_CANGL
MLEYSYVKVIHFPELLVGLYHVVSGYDIMFDLRFRINILEAFRRGDLLDKNTIINVWNNSCLFNITV